MGLKFATILKNKFKELRKTSNDPMESKKKKRQFILKLAQSYLPADMYFFFQEKYQSNRTSDLIAAKPIADYIERRYKYGRDEGFTKRNELRESILRRQQTNEGSVN